jgi:hypothetical protein
MKMCITGRTEFDISLARAMNSVGISIIEDENRADYVLSRERGNGIHISNDRSESADIHLDYAADISQSIKNPAKWASQILYLGEWDKRLIQLSAISSHRVCFFTGEEKWAENWCGTFDANYKNITSIIYATKILVSFEDSMSKRLAEFFGKNVVSKIDLEQISEMINKPERYPVERDYNNTIFDRLRELLLKLGGKARIYADLCEYSKQERIQCLE